MAEGDDMRVVVANPLDGAGPQSPDHADEASLTADLRRPPVHVLTEGDTRGERQILAARTLHLLPVE